MVRTLFVALSLCVACPQAKAVTFSESSDFPNTSGFNSFTFVGIFEEGANTVDGSLGGSCTNGDCNTVGDSQDSYLFEIPIGLQLDAITTDIDVLNSPSFYLTNTQIRTEDNSVSILNPRIDTSGSFTLSEPLPSGFYSFSVYGGPGDDGDFELNHLTTFTVSPAPIPEPSALVIAAIGMGFWQIRRRR